jgi:hypothetical protein
MGVMPHEKNEKINIYIKDLLGPGQPNLVLKKPEPY